MQDGGTALIVAAQCGHLDVVTELLRRNADPNSAMKDRATAVFVAAQNGHTSVARTLLNAGAKVNLGLQGGRGLRPDVMKFGTRVCVGAEKGVGVWVGLLGRLMEKGFSGES